MIHRHGADADFPHQHQPADEFYRQIYIKCLKVQRADRRIRVILFLVVAVVMIGTAFTFSTKEDPIGVLILKAKKSPIGAQISHIEQLLPW